MKNKQFIEDFYYKSFESNINEQMLDRDFVFPSKDVQEYIDKICNIDFRDFIEYVGGLESVQSIKSNNVFQFSSFDDCTTNICKKLNDTTDEGYNFVDIGKMLGQNQPEKKIGAYRKYGENAAKTANELGLVQIIDNYIFLSCLGKIFIKLDDMKKDKLLVFLILRSPFFIYIIKTALQKEIDIRDVISFLGKSTQRRRISNIKSLINYVKDNSSEEINNILKKVLI